MATVQQAFDLALQHHRAGRLAEAEALYRQILAEQPIHSNARQLLGVIAFDTGRRELGVEWMQQAIRFSPNNASAHFNLGEAYCVLGWLDEALSAFRCALRLRPDYPQAHNNQGNALKARGEIEGAIEAYRRAIELKPDYVAARSNLIYALHFLPGRNALTVAEEQRQWNERFSEPLKPFMRPPANDRQAERRLRIGYVSPEFRDHVIGRHLFPLLKAHDHRNFEILCYSGVQRPDEVTEAFRRCADRWRNTVGLADGALAELIRQDGVDMLVDLTQHLAGNRLTVFARKPAPVQVSFAGYPESTGVEAIEYRISDRWLEAEIAGTGAVEAAGPAAFPTERVFLLDSFWCYDPCGVEVEINELPATGTGWVTFGSLNNFCKVNEPLLKLWARVLREAKDARLVMLSGMGSHRQRTVEFLQGEGIEAERVEFAERCSRRAYLEMYHRLDIVLDTFPYNGHATSLDALWMGVPVVSLAGETRVSRGGRSVLTNLGLPELIAHLEDEYVEIATRLARDLPRLAELRRTLRPRMEASILMDAPRFARNIEAAYRAMWRRWCAEKTGVG